MGHPECRYRRTHIDSCLSERLHARDHLPDHQPRAQRLVARLEWFTDDSTQVNGNVDFSAVDPGGGADMVLGLALPALPFGPLLLDPDELMTPDRDLTIFGIDVSLPGNLFLKNHAETYAVPAQPGEVAVWSIAGPMPISDVTSSLDGASDAFELINEYIDDMSWGWGEVGT